MDQQYKIQGRKYLILFIIITLVQQSKAQDPLLGAIRWDAWTGSGNAVGLQVERSLGPSQFHYRVPFFGVEVDTGTVTIDGTFQDIIDEEIKYAYLGGLDYWAFVWYGASSGLDEARKLYHLSKYKGLVDYCLIIEDSRLINQLSIDEVLTEFANASYVRVMNDRPLLYFFGYETLKVQDIDSLRARSIRSGLGDPYIVELRQDGNMDVLENLHMDAFGLYAISWITNGAPYQDLVDAQLAQWNYIGKNLGHKIVPNVSTGWDKRPRHLNNVSWESDPGPDTWVQMPTPREIAENVQSAIEWMNKNPTVAESNTILIYAWNENDEGGWLCPTLYNYEGSARLDTLRKILGIERTIDTNEPVDTAAVTFMMRRNENIFRIYPNPVKANECLYLENFTTETMKFELYSLMGKLVKEILFTDKLSMGMNELQSGIYPYFVSSEKDLYISGKLVIN